MCVSENNRHEGLRIKCLFLGALFVCSAAPAKAQGPSPEAAPTLFPGGALLSYGSVITNRHVPVLSTTSVPPTAHPTFAHDGSFEFKWGFRTNFDFSFIVPIATRHFDFFTPSGETRVGGTGLGDAMLLLKYRFYRRDSERGTTQVSLQFGPKLPTGRADLRGTSGNLLPATLQPGTGSVDWLFGASWTYTGLFNLERLVADDETTYLLRQSGTQRTNVGSEFRSRFWLSYRPYQERTVGREWFVGPQLALVHLQDVRVSGVSQSGSGGTLLMAGATTFFGVRPGTHVWFSADFDVAHSNGLTFSPVRRRFTFGITQQFRVAK